jgi:hypothetical protein
MIQGETILAGGRTTLLPLSMTGIRRIHVEPDDIGDFLLELWLVRYLEPAYQVRLQAGFGLDALPARVADSRYSRHRPLALVRRVRRHLARRPGQHLARHSGRQRLLAGRPRLVAQSPSTPSSTYRSYQRQTHGFDLPVIRIIALVPWPSAVASTIRARQTALVLLLRSVMRFEPRSVCRADVDADVVSPHGRTLTDLRPNGNHLPVTKH